MSSSAAVDNLAVASHPPSAVEISCETVAGTTITSRSRALDVQHKRETAKATVKEVEVVRHGLRRLETRMHELESRVQYVNPWVVQYMWELLCELREKIGANCSHKREQTWINGTVGLEGHKRGIQPTIEMNINSSLSTLKQTPAAATMASGVKALSVSASPMRLFEESVDVDDDGLDTSLSSASDDGDVFSGNGAVVATGGTISISLEDGVGQGGINGDRGSKSAQRFEKSGGQLTRYVAMVETRWQVYRLLHEESIARMEITLGENTHRMFFLSRLTSGLATALQERESTYISSASLGPEKDSCTRRNATQMVVQRQNQNAVQRQREHRDVFDMPSPPRTEISSGLSPIAPAQSTSDFFSLLKGNDRYNAIQEGNRRGNRGVSDMFDNDSNSVASNSRQQCGINEQEVAIVACSLLKNGDFMQQLVEEVSRRLAAQIHQSDMPTEGSLSPSQGLPSALFLMVREAVNATAGVHNEAFYNQMQGWLTQEQKERAMQEERFWHRVTNYEEDWTRHATADREAKKEILQEHQRLLALGREDVESCRDVRRELLKLCGEVMCAVEHLPQPPVMPLWNGDGVDQPSNGNEAAPSGKMELRLETLSSVVNSLLSDMEALRKKTLEASAPQEGWRKQTDDRITTLQESMVDVQEAVAIVARKSRAVEERLVASKAEKAELSSFMERLQGLEQQLETLPSLLGNTQPPPPPLPPPNNATVGAELNLMSVEDAMICVQKVLVSRNANRLTTAVDPYTKAISALCATLQEVNHMYNVGTGTFGGSLHLIFALPPSSVPRSMASVCQAYLREHSVAELKESVSAIGLSFQIAKVLYDCYYWMQSHVLVVGESENELKQRSENNAILAKANQQGSEALLPRSVEATSSSPCKAPPSSALNDTYSKKEVLPLLEEPFTNIKKTSTTRCSIAVQTELSMATQPLAMVQTTDSNVLPVVEYGEESEGKQMERQNIDTTASTTLEVLAMGSPPNAGKSQSRVVHHYHHHHGCVVDTEYASSIPQCLAEGSTNPPPRFQGTELFQRQSNNSGQWNLAGGSSQGPSHRVETSAVEMNDPGERVIPLAVPSLNRSHVGTSGRGNVMIGRNGCDGYEYLDMAHTPSLSDECLPLPTAVSPFIDPQLPTNKVSHERHALKNHQPFYTALMQRGPHSYRNHTSNSNNSLREGGVRFDICSGGDGVHEAMPDSIQRYRSLFSTTTRSRDNVLAGRFAAQPHKGSSLHHDEKTLNGKGITRRR